MILNEYTLVKDVVRSGVTSNKNIYFKLDAIVNNSKRFKIDKSEIINAILSKADLSPEEIQKIVMDWREGEWENLTFIYLY